MPHLLPIARDVNLQQLSNAGQVIVVMLANEIQVIHDAHGLLEPRMQAAL